MEIFDGKPDTFLNMLISELFQSRIIHIMNNSLKFNYYFRVVPMGGLEVCARPRAVARERSGGLTGSATGTVSARPHCVVRERSGGLTGSATGNVSVSPHFVAREFRWTDGICHSYRLCETTVQKLDGLRGSATGIRSLTDQGL
jgi:hypothetical protein